MMNGMFAQYFLSILSATWRTRVQLWLFVMNSFARNACSVVQLGYMKPLCKYLWGWPLTAFRAGSRPGKRLHALP